MKNIEHLFFECDLSYTIWKEVLKRNGIRRDVASWSREGNMALIEGKGGGSEARIRLLTLSAVVYYIWWERNCQIFKQEGHDCCIALKKIEENIRYATWYWKGKKT